MTAVNTKIYIEQGATFSQTVSLKDVDGNAYNLTGYTVAAKMRPTATSSNLTATFTIAIAAPATLGQFTMSLPASTTATIPVTANDGPENVPTLYTYDVIITTGSTVTRVLQGEAIVSPEVTR